MRDLNLNDMVNHFGNSLRFRKTGKNEYIVTNKQGSDVGITTGQSRYWYWRCYDLLKYNKNKEDVNN